MAADSPLHLCVRTVVTVAAENGGTHSILILCVVSGTPRPHESARSPSLHSVVTLHVP